MNEKETQSMSSFVHLHEVINNVALKMVDKAQQDHIQNNETLITRPGKFK